MGPEAQSDASKPPLLETFSILNIRGLMPRTRQSKVPFISDILYDTPHIFFALTETWLLDQMEAETKIDGYQLLRADRKAHRRARIRDGGGAAVYINDNDMINHHIIMKYSAGGIEAIGVHLKTRNLVVIAVYRQPENSNQNQKSDSTQFKKFLKELNSTLKELSDPLPDVLLCGDFNLPHANWSTGGHDEPVSADIQTMISDLYSVISEHFLVQVVESSTHRAGNKLDLIFTNNADFVHSQSSNPTSLSDHKIIECKVRYVQREGPKSENSNKKQQPEEEVSFYDLNFFSDDTAWNRLKQDLSAVNWYRLFLKSDPCGMMDTFLSTCLNISKLHVPLKHPNDKSRKKGSRIPRHRKILLRNRRNVQKQLLKAESLNRIKELNQKLIQIEKKLQSSHHSERSAEEKRAVEKIKLNPKYFYSYAQKFSKVRVGTGPLLDATNTLTACPTKMSELLSEQYASVFSKPIMTDEEIHSLFHGQDLNQKLCDVFFTELDIEEAISELADNSSAGPDNFPAKLLKECKSELSLPLYVIWRESLNTGKIPATCKSANIVPIYKGQGKSRAEAKSYRPVALTSILIKIFEKILRKSIVEYFNKHELFNKNQHGFRSARSCLSQLLSHFDQVIRLLEEGKIVDVIYLDFAKAFDKVDIGLTLKKLHQHGIGGKLGLWLEAFLTQRVQQVIVDGQVSSPRQVMSGVPQGSVLGPLLFLVLIGDIDSDVVRSFVSSFADDTRIGKGICCEQDLETLQEDLNTIYLWAKANNMELNDEKFEHLRYLPTKSTPPPCVNPYKSSSDTPIEEKSKLRDLGVTMSNDATFREYISQKVDRMKSTMGWILRTFRTRETLPLLTLYKSLVLSDHDYCSQLWNPSSIGLIQSLENVQHSFTRKIQSVQELSYWDRLSALKLYSLQRRRERYIVIYVWKILEGLVPNISSSSSAIKARANGRIGRRCQVPPISTTSPKAIQSIREASFAVIGPNLFNSLPRYLRDISKEECTVPQFKARLDSFLSTVPDQPLITGYTQYRQSETNSLVHWLGNAHLRSRMEGSARQSWSGSSGGD